MRILYTAFEPFGNFDINSSLVVMNKVYEKRFENEDITTAIIKLEFDSIRFQIRELIDKISPNIILLSGQATRPAISIEKVAINYVNSKNARYNDGKKIPPQKLLDNAPDAYFSTFPVENIIGFLRQKNIPVKLSLSAGSFGCNQIFFETMYYLDKLGKLDETFAGFVHIPLLPQQAPEGDKPTVHLDILTKAINLILDFLLNGLS